MSNTLRCHWKNTDSGNYWSVWCQTHYDVTEKTLTLEIIGQCDVKHITMSLKKHWLWKLLVSVMSNTLQYHWKNTDSGNYWSVWCQTHNDVTVKTLTLEIIGQCDVKHITMSLKKHWLWKLLVSVMSNTLWCHCKNNNVSFEGLVILYIIDFRTKKFPAKK